jgi:hypothetical protein
VAENYDQGTWLGKRKNISVLPLKLAGSRALTQGKRNVLAHWRCDHEILVTRK